MDRGNLLEKKTLPLTDTSQAFRIISLPSRFQKFLPFFKVLSVDEHRKSNLTSPF